MLPPNLLDLTLSRISPGPAVQIFRRGLATVSTAQPHARELALFDKNSDIQDSDDYFWKAPKRMTWAELRRETLARRGRVPAVRQKQSTSMTARSGKNGNLRPDAELARRVDDLEIATNELEAEALRDQSVITEEELLLIYQDVLALPPPDDYVGVSPRVAEENINLALQEESDQRLLAQMDFRLQAQIRPPDLQKEASTSSLAATLRTLRKDIEPISTPTGLTSEQLQNVSQHQRVLLNAQALVQRMESSSSALSLSSYVEDSPLPIRISPFSNAEFEALIRTCVRNHDGESAETTLDLMLRLGMAIPEAHMNNVLEMYGDKGDVASVEAFFVRFVKDVPTTQQRHLHIRSYLKANMPQTIPAAALSVLHHYESKGLPAPIKTYSKVITTLFTTHIAAARAQAWDLYAHMRYVAHPNPDKHMYALMIRACCSSPISRAEPERALDLWTEMTVDRKMTPTAGAYSAVILACARSGQKMYINEAFRLAQEMLETHRDAQGNSPFAPDVRLFCAILEGAKRIGDLPRARWILAEMVRTGNSKEEFVSEEVMMHIFHTYSAYKPPYKRSMAPDENLEINHEEKPATSSREETTAPQVPIILKQRTFTHLPPQSRSETIEEAKSLFLRVIEDTGVQFSGVDPAEMVAAPAKKFQHVKLTARLLNSYLSVFYTHAQLKEAWKLFDTVFIETGVARTAHSFVDALERCANTRRGNDRIVAGQFSDAVWQEWVELEASNAIPGISARLIEKAHVARIRMLTLLGKTDVAVQHVKSFMHQYKPDDIRHISEKPDFRSTRTVLAAGRPLVRMMSQAEVPDEAVPPLLTFRDLEVLHHRLVAERDIQGLGLIKYACKAYECALRDRRDSTMKSEPIQVAATALTKLSEY